MDPAVSQRKFNREIELLRGETHTIVQAAGWEIAEATYPFLAVIFTHPRSQRRVGFRFLCDDWDELPPSLALFDPKAKTELEWAQWPQGGWNAGHPHPSTGKPFL